MWFFSEVIPVTFHLQIWGLISLIECQVPISENVDTLLHQSLTNSQLYTHTHTQHNWIFKLSQYINKVTRKTGLPQQRFYRVHKIQTGRGQDQGVVFFRKPFYQKHEDRSNLKCSRHSKCTTDSKLPFSMLCIIL